MTNYMKSRISFYVYIAVRNLLPSEKSDSNKFRTLVGAYMKALTSLYKTVESTGVEIDTPWDLFKYFMVRPGSNTKFQDLKFPDWRVIDEIAEGVKHGVYLYRYSLYDWRQLHEIRLGLEKKVDVSKYTDPGFNHLQMKEIREWLETGIPLPNVDLTAMSSSSIYCELNKCKLVEYCKNKGFDPGRILVLPAPNEEEYYLAIQGLDHGHDPKYFYYTDRVDDCSEGIRTAIELLDKSRKGGPEHYEKWCKRILNEIMGSLEVVPTLLTLPEERSEEIPY